jgi:hypothetical protein
MNSRIGFDLLPDLVSLPVPPTVVVQLHVEEPDKSGYVRYVTTRYGNLVDAFSVSSMHLAQVLEDYGIASSKVHVIHTGVDAEGEFNPSKAIPMDIVGDDRFNILFPGRLTDQKDPLLMVEVIRQVVDEHERVHVHVVGDGPLDRQVRRRVSELEIDSHFTFHSPSRELARWYACCDLLLMTSLFEGVPYVIYEAMAMALPIVAPALPGNLELMEGAGGLLIEPRDEAAGYARAVSRLIDRRAERESLAMAGRSRVIESFNLRAIGDRYAELYQKLLETRAAAGRTNGSSTLARAVTDSRHARSVPGADALRTERLKMGWSSTRPSRGHPLVSVIIPCFNHGRFLPECIDSVINQSYGSLEVIVVDDCSSDSATIRVIGEIEDHPMIRVIRLPQNSGPSVARNCGIAEANGRYILPVDADNVLLPNAVADLVEQIQSAGEWVGYIYPNYQFFGTRDDYFQPPKFNLALLLAGNYCDTCSLIDRTVFDSGFCYPEDIGLGHEDWDFVLTLAENGIRGEPARAATLLYRKLGFTRSDAVEYASSAFHEEVERRHPELYGPRASVGRFGRWSGPAMRIKTRFAPSTSIIVVSPVDFGSEIGQGLLACLQAQSCSDSELIVECPGAPEQQSALSLRRIPPGLCANEIERVQEALHMARGSVTVLSDEAFYELIRDRGFIERLRRTLWARPSLDAIAFVDAGEHGRFPYRLLKDQEILGRAHSLAWRDSANEKLPSSLGVAASHVAESIARTMSVRGVDLQWRHAPSRYTVEAATADGWLELVQRGGERDPHQRAETRMMTQVGPALPAVPPDAVRRWLGEVSWMPPETSVLSRHREIGGARRIVKLGRSSPEGFLLERDLGALQRFAPPGTTRLVRSGSHFKAMERSSPRSEEDQELGHLETSPLPLFQTIERAVLSDGTETLVNGEGDALRDGARQLEFLGFIEAFPNKPSWPPDARRSGHGLGGLLRCVNRAERRHVYRIGSSAPGDELVAELGAVYLTGEPGMIALYIDEGGRVATDRHALGTDAADTRKLVRWAAAPLGWRSFGHVRGRVRSVARRSYELPGMWAHRAREQRARGVGRSQVAAGYLLAEPGPERHELFAAIHPVTGDQLLTPYSLEAADMGYGDAVSIGYVLDQAIVTGSLEIRRVPVPWASRFGLEVRRG